jgi:hypothetical protein
MVDIYTRLQVRKAQLLGIQNERGLTHDERSALITINMELGHMDRLGRTPFAQDSGHETQKVA